MQRVFFLSLLLLLAAGCAGPVRSLYPPKPGEVTRTVYVINHGGLHTGIAVERAHIPTNDWPASLDYPDARYIEVGWGDDDGYRKDLTPWIVTKALFWPTRSVLQMDGFTNSVAENFSDPDFTIIEVRLSQAGFERLCRRIGDSFAVDASGKAVCYGDDWYKARGKYCLVNTCNNWVARALRSAGCPITPGYCMLPGPLLCQTRKFGHVVPPHKEHAPGGRP